MEAPLVNTDSEVLDAIYPDGLVMWMTQEELDELINTLGEWTPVAE